MQVRDLQNFFADMETAVEKYLLSLTYCNVGSLALDTKDRVFMIDGIEYTLLPFSVGLRSFGIMSIIKTAVIHIIVDEMYAPSWTWNSDVNEG